MGYIPKGISSWRTYAGVSRGYKLVIPMIPFAVFLYLFYQLGSFMPLPEKSRLFWRVASRSLTEECVLRVGAMGVTLMAVLSGFGSICAGWAMYFTPYRYSTFDKVDGRLVTEADVVRAKTSVEMTQDLINEKHHKIEQIENRIHEKVFLEPHLFQSQEVHSFMNRVVNSVRGDSDHQGSSVLLV
jgi:The Golgi pH Regulator (GPHR) Family N-terminal